MIPSQQEQLGLLGELLFLRQLLDEGFSEPVKAWQGPEGARHDFLTSTWGAEVKTSLSISKKTIHVHGKKQLCKQENQVLGLVLFQVERALGGLTIAKNLQYLMQLLGRQVFETKLRKFFPDGLVQIPSWANDLEVTVHAKSVFHVDEAFPILDLDAIPQVSNRITRLEYQLNLDGVKCKDLGKTSWTDWLAGG
jgi:hypothetical protein